MCVLTFFRTTLIALATLLLLAGCDSPEERAEKFYLSGMELMAEGKVEQAKIEFQNALKNRPDHDAARRAFAEALLSEGKVFDAYVQYIRFIEFRPDTPDVRRKLAEMAIIGSNWDEAERHGREALRLDPDAPGAQSIRIALDYHAAITADLATVDATRAALFDEAVALLAANPADRVARRVTIDHLITGPTPLSALPEVEAALQTEPADLALNGLKASLLARSGNDAALVAQLDHMVALFPDDRDLPRTLMQLLVGKGDLDRAEALARAQTGDPAEDIEGNVALITFLRAHRGPDAVARQIESVEAATAGKPAAAAYRGVRAMFDFDAGQQDGRLAALEAAIAELPAEVPFRLVLQAGLARMQIALGDPAKARTILDAAIAQDRTFAEALRLRAGLSLDAGRRAEAISDLRTALDQNPQDVDALLLLAEAHEADGDLDLAGDRLAEASAASGNAPAVTLRQAEFLSAQGRLRAADTVLAEALVANADDLALLTARVDLMLRDGRADEAASLVDRLAALPGAEAAVIARQLRVLVLDGQGKQAESLSLLRDLARGNDGNLSLELTLIERLAADGQLDAALTEAQLAAKRHPDDPRLMALTGSLLLQQGRGAEAEAAWTALLAQNAAFLPALTPLVDHLVATGRADQAQAHLRAAVAAAPASAQLRGMLALRLEADGDSEGAIAAYRDILSQSANNPVAANNLISLLVWTRDDPDSLTEAARLAPQIARMPEPAVQDTLGWLAYRQGKFGDAVLALSQAARALPQDALVQYRYARALEASGRGREAAAQYQHFLTLRDAAPALQVADAEDRVKSLTAPLSP